MKRQWTPEELIEQWTLVPDELALVGNKAGPARVGFAVLLKYFQPAGSTPQAKHDIPGQIIAYIAKYVGGTTEHYLQYDWGGRAIEHHHAHIRAALGFRQATVDDGDDLVAWLVETILPSEHRRDRLPDVLRQQCRVLHLEPPSPGRIARLVRSAVHTYETQLFATTLAQLTPVQLAAVDALVRKPARADIPRADPLAITFQDLRANPGRVGLDSLLDEIAKLRRIRALTLPRTLFQQVAPKVVHLYRQRAAVETPSALRAHPEPIRIMLLTALCWERGQEITDNLADLLIQIVHTIGMRAERSVEREFLRDLRRVTGKTTLLFQIAEAAVGAPEGRVKDVIYPVAGETTLHELVKEYKATGPAYRRHIHTVMRSSYRPVANMFVIYNVSDSTTSFWGEDGAPPVHMPSFVA